jgi:hypothetical protein
MPTELPEDWTEFARLWKERHFVTILAMDTDTLTNKHALTFKAQW